MILAYEARKITEDNSLFKEMIEYLEHAVINAAEHGLYNVNWGACKHVDENMVKRIEKFLIEAGYTVDIRTPGANSITIELEWRRGGVI